MATILFDKEAHVACITLNRPAANIINQQMADEVADVCRQVNRDNDIYVTIITGGGAVFCGGSELTTGMADAIAGINVPVIAALNGDALGQGLEIALSCDIRLASYQARFGLNHLAQGLFPADGGTQRLPRIIGKGKALELMLTAEIINAEEASKSGLVNKLVARENLMAEARSLAGNLAGKAPAALRYIKEAINKGLDLTLDQGLRLEADLYFLLHTTLDRTEGVTAFLQKRPPNFKGE